MDGPVFGPFPFSVDPVPDKGHRQFQGQETEPGLAQIGLPNPGNGFRKIVLPIKEVLGPGLFPPDLRRE